MRVESWSVSAGAVHFVVGVDKKLWVGSGLLKNCNSLFGAQGAVFGGKSFDCTDLVALSDDAEVVPPRWLAGDGFALWNWVAKCLACESDFSPSLTSCWASLKCCCILAVKFCCVFSMCTFPVLLHLTLQTVVEFLHMLLRSPSSS